MGDNCLNQTNSMVLTAVWFPFVTETNQMRGKCLFDFMSFNVHAVGTFITEFILLADEFISVF